MGTLAELKARILDEMPEAVSPRQIGQHITRAIDSYADRRFWFNVRNGTTVTVADNAYAALPTGLRNEDIALVTIGSSPCELDKQSFAEIEDLASGSTSSGQPTDYAITDTQARLYPTPNAVYTLTFAGIYDEAALTTDASSNAWTTEAADLIAACAKKTMFRDLLGEDQRAASMEKAELQALSRLKADTVSRLGTGVMRANA